MSSAFALRNAFDDVHQHDVGEFLIGDAQRAIRADIAGAHNGTFFRTDSSSLSVGISFRLKHQLSGIGAAGLRFQRAKPENAST